MFRELTPIVHNLFQKIAEVGTPPKSFPKAYTTPTPKLVKDIKSKENHRPTFPMDMEKKFSTKY